MALWGKVLSQEPVYVNYTVNEGLAGDVVYDIVQDSQGFIWVATESGVSRFDGIEFQNFSQSDGLPPGEVLKLFADRKGRVWFVTLGGEIAYSYGGSFYNRKNHSELAKIEAKNYYTIFFEDGAGDTWIAQRGSGLYHITGGTENSTRITRIDEVYDAFFYGIWEDGEQVCIWSIDTLNRIDPSGRVSKQLFQPTVGGIWETIQVSNNEIIVRDQSNVMVVNSEWKEMDTICAFPNAKSKQAFFPINSMLIDSEGDLWLAKNDGVRRYSDPEGARRPKPSFLNGHPVSCVFQDKEGNLWFGSLRKGIFFASVQALQTEFYGEMKDDGSNEAISVGKVGEQVIVGMGNGTLALWNGRGFERFVFREGVQDRRWVRKILPVNEAEAWIAGDQRLLESFDQGLRTTSPVTPAVHLESVKDLVLDDSGFVYIGWNRACERINLREDWSSSGARGTVVFRGRCNALAKDADQRIWLGTENGIGYAEGTRFISSEVIPELVDQSITDLEFDGAGRIWVAVHGNGLFVSENGRVWHITEKEGLLSNNCKRIATYQDEVWVATNQGINQFLFRDGEFKFRAYTRMDGLPSNDVNAVEIYDDTLWAATRRGIIRFPYHNEIDSLPAPELYLGSVNVNDSSRNPELIGELSHKENNLHIEMVALSFHSQGQLTYRYQLIGLHDQWHETEQGMLTFEGLAPGDYELVVKTRGYRTVWSSPESLLSFTIRSPLWQTWWFISLCLLLLLSLVVLIVRSILKRADRQAEMSLLLAKSEQKALRAQMNPHFIFNCLNSIQMFIMDNDQDLAYDYLQKFGSLIRMILEHSREESIPLEKEIKTLSIYLELEALRFDQPLQYDISIDPAIDQISTRIPSMLIQPYVENAIIHGLSPKSGDLKLAIEIRQKGSILICDIRDNGVGQKAAAELREKKERSHRSIGLTATEERLKILNARRGDQESLSVVIHDLIQSDGSSGGTHVQILVPQE